MANSIITLQNFSKKFGEQQIIDNLSLTIYENEIVALFGPNGCGKSTILNSIASEENKSIVKNFKKEEFSYVFQNYRESLYPWKTNEENIAFPLLIQGINKEEITTRVAEIMQIFEFKENSKYPYQLSGGQQQIVAIMRALITKPSLLCIDEPFSALDYENNLMIRKYILKYYNKYHPTIVIVTHNIEEAVHLANKIIVLSKKPTQIKKIIENTEQYPRSIAFLQSETFHNIKNDVLTVFEEGI